MLLGTRADPIEVTTVAQLVRRLRTTLPVVG